MTIFSQNDEEVHILKYFEGSTGRFLDIGAYDGKQFSNTYALAQLGWKGICMEPSVSCFQSLLQLYKSNLGIECVNAALDTEKRIVKFYDSNGDALSTTSKEHTKKWAALVEFKQMWIATTTIEDVLSTFGETYDMINLDVEGTNLRLLQTLPLERMNVKLICVEYENYLDEVKAYCKGYRQIHLTNENVILAK